MSVILERWSVGDQFECPHSNNYGRIAWGDTPTPEQRDAIRSLTLRPSPSQVWPAVLPGWIVELPHCHELVLPILHLAELHPEHLPARLDTLLFESSQRWIGPDGFPIPSWPSALCLPELRSLTITGPMTGIPEGLRPELAPALAYVSATMDKQGELLEELIGFANLRELELHNVGNYDVFEPLEGKIEILRVHGSGRRFPFDAITRWGSIERLDLGYMQGTIDCAWLSELPRLAELRMIYCKKLTAVEALLECSALRSVELLYCGKPFDAALSKAFAEHGFEWLEISRA